MMKSYTEIIAVEVKIKKQNYKTKQKKKPKQTEKKDTWRLGKISRGWEVNEHKYSKIRGGGGWSASYGREQEEKVKIIWWERSEMLL